MANNSIELRTIGTLLGLNFYIPSYQRGYRWTEVQVLDLLNDIDHFIAKHKEGQSDFYCLQPLVVKETVPDVEKFISSLPQTGEENALEATRAAIFENTRWEVIDGQQRLTTLYIILSYLSTQCNSGIACFDKKELYSLEYQTRSDSKSFLQEITNCTRSQIDGKEPIDYSFMRQAYSTVVDWFELEKKKDSEYKSFFTSVILHQVQFIWYETREKSTTVFKRLNLGKIGLTNAELIKALFLNRSQYAEYEGRKLMIANQWDEFEMKLQNDEFWLFLHSVNYDKPTRMEYIFDVMCEIGVLDAFIDFKKDKKKTIGTDKYRTFRYFNAFFESEQAEETAKKNKLSLIELCWNEVKEIFRIFEEWNTSLELYHYVGYLVANDTNIVDLLRLWNPKYQNKAIDDFKSGKDEFVKQLKSLIRNKVASCKDLNKQYEVDNGDKKTVCRPLLLLHNVQTVINQNRSFMEKEDYKLGVFYKFPFHLYKKESWNVEHIDSNTTNSLDTPEEKYNWLKVSWCFLPEDNQCREEILEYINSKDEDKDFDKLQDEILKCFNYKGNLSQSEKNKVGNFVLLDERTNKSYGNAIFPMKKIVISGKDHGIIYDVEKITSANGIIQGFKIIQKKESRTYKTAFVPPITKSAFLKEFNPLSVNPYTWDEDDANAYVKNIEETLAEFIKQ